jgi:hypothetical protein
MHEIKQKAITSNIVLCPFLSWKAVPFTFLVLEGLSGTCKCRTALSRASDNFPSFLHMRKNRRWGTALHGPLGGTLPCGQMANMRKSSYSSACRARSVQCHHAARSGHQCHHAARSGHQCHHAARSPHQINRDWPPIAPIGSTHMRPVQTMLRAASSDRSSRYAAHCTHATGRGTGRNRYHTIEMIGALLD